MTHQDDDGIRYYHDATGYHRKDEDRCEICIGYDGANRLVVVCRRHPNGVFGGLKKCCEPAARRFMDRLNDIFANI